MSTEPKDAEPESLEDLPDGAPSVWDQVAHMRRQLGLRAWWDWPSDLPAEIGPPRGVLERK